MEKLELKHIAPYLHYGLKAEMLDYKCDYVGKQYDEIVGVHQWDKNCLYWSVLTIGGSKPNIERIKPILLPLSTIDLKFFKDNIDDSIENFIINCEPENNHFSVEVCESVLGWSALSFEEYQLFFKYHIDVFGLIDKGLAVDINTLEK